MPKRPGTNPSAQLPLDVKSCVGFVDSAVGQGITVPAGGCIACANKSYVLAMDRSGLLEVRPVGSDGVVTGSAVWKSTGVSGGLGAAHAVIEDDGNLVVFDDQLKRPIWSSNVTSGRGVYRVTVSDKGVAQVNDLQTGL